jgi:acyl-coenzyme A thioesterase PaaI-like protein
MAKLLSIQQRLYPNSTCFGCGPANPSGLQLHSFEGSDGVEAAYQPRHLLSNGMDTLNGGIIATLLDCHSGSAVFLASAVDGSISALWVTTELEVRYRLPVPLDEPIALRARIIERDDTSMVVAATLALNGKVRVQAQTRWARVRSVQTHATSHLPVDDLSAY